MRLHNDSSRSTWEMQRVLRRTAREAGVSTRGLDVEVYDAPAEWIYGPEQPLGYTIRSPYGYTIQLFIYPHQNSLNIAGVFAHELHHLQEWKTGGNPTRPGAEDEACAFARGVTVKLL